MSRAVPPSERYVTSSVVLMTEVVKLVGSLVAVIYATNLRSVYQFMTSATSWQNSWALIFPAIVYTISNNLAYISLTYLPAAEFQLLTQGKTLTTAVFAVVFLGTRLTRLQWMALVLLVLGVMLAQLPQAPSGQSAQFSSNSVGDHFKGVVAVLILCVLSGAAGIYQEKILKKYIDLSINYLNAQLALFSLVTNGIAMFLQDSDTILEKGLFHGYNPLVWSVVMVASLGGIMVSLVIRHTSNLAKTYAVSMAILAVSFVSYWIDPNAAQLSVAWFLAAMVVIISVLLFTDPASQPPKDAPAPAPAPVVEKSSELEQLVSSESADAEPTAKSVTVLTSRGSPQTTASTVINVAHDDSDSRDK
jgi:UDP-sugar transporter A1/2/3